MPVFDLPRRAVADVFDLIGEAAAALATTTAVVIARTVGPGPRPDVRPDPDTGRT